MTKMKSGQNIQNIEPALGNFLLVQWLGLDMLTVEDPGCITKKESALKRAWVEAMLNPNHYLYLRGVTKQNERSAISTDRDRVGGRRVG